MYEHKVDNKIGIGIDIEDVARFEGKNAENSQPFLQKIFTTRELAYCFSKVSPAPHLAARYAGKEAVVKALATIGEGLVTILDYRRIEIVNNPQGIAVVKLGTHLRGNFKIFVSLSHCKDKAICFAIAIKL